VLLQVDLGPERVHEALLLATALFAQKVFLHEVFAEIVVVTEDDVSARASRSLVGVAEVAEKVITAHVAVQVVVVDEPFITELAQRVTAV
jgi:hypothetical protein